MDPDCIFCAIAKGNCPKTKTEYKNENEDVIVFKDIRPASDYHFLAITREHKYSNVRQLSSNDIELVKDMKASLTKVFGDNGADASQAIFGFHSPLFSRVHHLHMHGITPASKMGFANRLIFRPDSFWFSTTEKILSQLEEQKLAQKSTGPDDLSNL